MSGKALCPDRNLDQIKKKEEKKRQRDQEEDEKSSEILEVSQNERLEELDYDKLYPF